MGKYFGTDGFRGEANVELTAEHAYKVGRFVGDYYCKVKKKAGDSSPARVVIGKDTRRSGYMLEYAVVSGLVASGADAYLLQNSGYDKAIQASQKREQVRDHAPR